jgi:hypothetical protein
VAKGDPTPRYTWTRDKRIYDPSSQNNRVAMKSNAGTLIITNPTAADQGWYQCNATNQYGTALTFATRLRMAELSQFPYSTRSKIVRARRGDWVILDCTPPTGVPDPFIYWSIVGDTDRDQFGTIAVSARVTQDYYGTFSYSSYFQIREKKRQVNVFFLILIFRQVIYTQRRRRGRKRQATVCM